MSRYAAPYLPGNNVDNFVLPKNTPRSLFGLFQASIEYLVVAGGGGSGGTQNALTFGGNAGQVLTGTVSIANTSVTVGAGGAAGPGWSTTVGSSPGGTSSLGGISASGGAGSPNTLFSGGSFSALGQGGNGTSAAGTRNTAQAGVAAGVTSSITGSSVRYGDGHSYWNLDQNPPSHSANLGHGGWGVWSNANRAGGAGSSGVVIIRYANTNPDLVIGSGITYRNSSGVNTAGNGTRVSPSFSPSGFKVYQFNAGTGSIAF